MNLLIKILQAAHCRSTHHYFVLDALPYVTTPRGKRLCRVLLHHQQNYLLGAKAPDKTFRDFTNHVLHVGDNYWGGAAKTADKWYRKLLSNLDQQQWEDAAYSAGVLSHYFADVLMPLHTAQSEKESVVHRSMEWSVTQSYRKIRKRSEIATFQQKFILPNGPSWVARSVMQGAESANQHYDELIQRYDLDAASKDPQSGLDDRSIDIFAGLFSSVIRGWAQFIERAADESRSVIPKLPVSLTTAVAAINVPSQWVTRRAEEGEERVAIQAIFDEFQATGQVVENLPEEVKAVQQERELERVAEQAIEQEDIVEFRPRIRTTDFVVPPSPAALQHLERPKRLATRHRQEQLAARQTKAPQHQTSVEDQPVKKDEHETVLIQQSETVVIEQADITNERVVKQVAEQASTQPKPKLLSPAQEPAVQNQNIADTHSPRKQSESAEKEKPEKEKPEQDNTAEDNTAEENTAEENTARENTAPSVDHNETNGASEPQSQKIKLADLEPTETPAPAAAPTSFGNRDQIREQFDAAITKAKSSNKNSEEQKKRRQQAALDRMVAARQRRDASQRNGQVVGPVRSLKVEKPKRKLAVPTVPTKFLKPRLAPGTAQQEPDRQQSNTPQREVAQPPSQPKRQASVTRSLPPKRRSRLTPTDNLVDAPSIGPKTAERFEKIGIQTVADFLAGSPSDMSAALKTSWINSDKLRQWQRQAQLVCDIPSLCGYKAQLLVGVECIDATMLAEASASRLARRIANFAKTSEGKSALRSSKVPTQIDIQQWIADAQDISKESLPLVA